MPQSNAQNQTEYKKRMLAAGYKRVEAWIHPEDKGVIRSVAGALRNNRETGKQFKITIEREQREVEGAATGETNLVL